MSGSSTTMKMAVKRTEVIQKDNIAFALFSDGFHPQTDEAHINKRLNEGRITEGSVKTKPAKTVRIADPRKFHPVKIRVRIRYIHNEASLSSTSII